MLIPLICKQCGGKLEVEDTKISLLGESFIVLPNQNFECPHCGTKYASDNTGTQVYATGGSIAFGSINISEDFYGDIVIGGGVSPDTTPIKTDKSSFESSHVVIEHEVISATPSLETKQQTKKWWEFWK